MRPLPLGPTVQTKLNTPSGTLSSHDMVAKDTILSMKHRCFQKMAYFQQQSVIRCSAREQGMRWRWEGIAGRRFCYTPTHLHPLTIVQGIWPMRLVFVDCLVPVDSMSLVIQFDPEHVFDDADPNNENQFHRLIMGWKYTQPRHWRRFEDPNFCRWNTMVQLRMANKEIRVLCGYWNISNYQDLG